MKPIFAFLLTVATLAGAMMVCGSCKKNDKLFQLVAPDDSGIDFSNTIIENDSINPINLINVYNGGGVGVGDFNNDGLQDIYFTGNMVSNKLYLNRGEMQFEDITASAGVGGNGKWCRGVAVIDINNDGWMDMYVCASVHGDPEKRKNLLYINQGKTESGAVTFKESAADYGLDDSSHTTMASFFDYDNDGDLDVYLVVNQMLPKVDPSTFKSKITDGSFPSTGRLYRNDPNPALKHPVFTNVTSQAGVTIEGYGHSVNITDVNRDGWKDIFVSNDFISNDLLYINNHDGTFIDKAASYFKHTSANGMGQDVIDINNDGLSDVVELDMNPEDNYRKKMMMMPGSYQSFQLNDFYKYQYQYVRNTIQINQGPRVNANDSIGDPIFSDAGYISGITATDWSWTPLVADFDNDGLRDMVVTNGFPKDVTDHDFMAYRLEAAPVTPQSETLKQIPEVKLHNYAFKNAGNCAFNDVSGDWGLTDISFSNGAAYADLDNDGDLDMVVNNINDPASLYENTMMDAKPADKHYLTVELAGDALNRNGMGAWVDLYYAGGHQAYEQTPYRGYLSSVQLNPYFGLGTVSVIDSLIVKWPDGSKQKMLNVKADQIVKVNKTASNGKYDWSGPALAQNTLFREITSSLGIRLEHAQMDHIDFTIQKLLPHKLSEYGPSLAAGDLNADGLDDMIVGGSSSSGTAVLMQQANGSFAQKTLVPPGADPNMHYQDMGILLFDADRDNDPDMYIARGGYSAKSGSPAYRDQFYVNDGKGNFTLDSLVFPSNLTSKSCVRAADYDKDGDLDLFVGGRVDPWNYPKPVSSFIYRNDSKNGKARFTDVTAKVAGGLGNIGLVCDVTFSDFDNDGWPDLVLAGEWMPLTFFKNDKGTFKNVTAATGISGHQGWWNSLVTGDFDNDGDTDYIAGNLGRNSFFQATEQYPVSVYAKDFDNNGSYDAFPALYIRTSQEDPTQKEYPAHMRDDAVKQMIGMRAKFQNYKSYANATMGQLFTPEQMEGALVLKASNLSSSYCRNDGGGKFTLVPLPFAAQLSALNGMLADDFDGDGNLDLIMNTNDYGTDVSIGRYDALNGLMLKGDGKGNFAAKSILESGIFIPGNGKALVKLRGKDGKYLAAAGQNRGPLKVFELKRDLAGVPLKPGDASAEITFADGRKQKAEVNYGSSFLSQSARFLSIGKSVKSVSVTDGVGKARKIDF
ncbi:VCBS repeat-containing protein [Dyadobacter pollutisoli]|uniref:VCBS repeat-containing protein n=1 Tax=Dyadobacter pollutisoli TaxID=2910158 RepID=A0A9E8SHM9_9BACT|nr:VCBS repeat-containing protein [Dyadobacter pollutisoli]WAC09240.1 VCBS repeat-containing protein [Dyadobacter pollutisoli]